MPSEELISVCLNTFTESTISDAKLCLFDACKRGPGDTPPATGSKFRKRNADHKRMENELTDIKTLFQKLCSEAPKFAAVNLNALYRLCLRTK